MSIEELQNFAFLSYIIAAVLLLLGIALYFVLDVPRLYNELSGRAAKKAIAAINQQNMKTQTSGSLQAMSDGRLRTEKFSTETMAPKAAETTILTEPSGATTILTEPSGATTILTEPSGATTILTEPSGATTILAEPPDNSNGYTESLSMPETGSFNEGGYEDFSIDFELFFRESTELIE